MNTQFWKKSCPSCST